MGPRGREIVQDVKVYMGLLICALCLSVHHFNLCHRQLLSLQMSNHNLVNDTYERILLTYKYRETDIQNPLKISSTEILVD